MTEMWHLVPFLAFLGHLGAPKRGRGLKKSSGTPRVCILTLLGYPHVKFDEFWVLFARDAM